MKTFFTPSGRRIERVGLYARVSSSKQEDNTSLVGQLDDGRAFASEYGLEVVADLFDVITGKSRWGARTKFNELLKMGEQGLLEAIVIDVPDRLGRGRALATLLDRTEKRDLRLLFANGEVLDSVNLGVNIIKSGGESDAHSKRVYKGMVKTALKGDIVFSIPPYGLKIIKTYDPETGKRLNAIAKLDPEEIEHVINIFHWLVNERESLHGIALKLYENKILPPGIKKRMLKEFGHADWDKVPEGWSREWSRQSIKRILSNEVYMGKWYFNRRQTTQIETEDRMKQSVIGVRPESEWICVEVPQAISKELFEQAQIILRKNRERAGRPSTRQYLLKSMLYCTCGRRMATGGDNGRYVCNRNTSVKKCKYPSLPQDLVENLVWGYVSLALMDTEKLEQEFEKRQELEKKRNKLLREQIESLQASIHKSSRKLDNLLDALLEEVINQATYKQKQKAIDDAIEDDKLELARVQSQLEQKRFIEEQKADFWRFVREETHKILVENPTFEEKRRILLKLDTKVSYVAEENALLIQGTFPTVHSYMSHPMDSEGHVTAKWRKLQKCQSRSTVFDNFSFAVMLPFDKSTFTELLPNNRGFNTIKPCVL